ncbi:MAG TPA: nitrilase-related carbon-nitrogen hydrolase [Anaerolineales bacterium]|nr:nitrilase-related carbon-nitrogen hydrolase [Anaerolineales bacterium]
MNKNLRYLWLVLAAVLGLFAGGKWNIPLAAWLVPVFMLRFFRDSDKAGRNFLLLWLASAIPAIISWNGATFFPLPVEAAFFLGMAPIGLIANIIDRIYYRRFPNSAWITLVYPIAYTAVDFFSSSDSPFGTFGAVAYSQRDFLPIMQIVSVTGLWGITFIIGWFASLVNYVWENGFKIDRFAMVSASVLGIILALGLGRTLLPTQTGQTAVIAGFSLPDGKMREVLSQLEGRDGAGFRQAVNKLHAEELNQIRILAGEGAGIVSMQEAAGMGMTDQVETLIANASALAKEQGIYIILPTLDVEKSPVENVVHIIDPNGVVVLTHVKYGGNQFEGSLKGNGVLQTVDTPYGKLSAVICWDADFPNVIRQAGEQNVDLLFVPANDWLAVKDIHAGMAAFRAVENGMSIYRQTGSGVSSVIDAYGRTIHRVDAFEQEGTGNFAAVQMVTTPINSVNTLYRVTGDVMGNIMLVLFVGLLAGLWLSRKQAAKRVDVESVPA